jgi:CRISPR-associated endonuclease/helicase Cas3
VLDSFANRIGDNTWQTVITQEGLLAVKKLLRKTASKNTAVSCFWIRSRSRSEFVWVVGNKNKFNAEGYVPVNQTQRNILHTEWESKWFYASSIQIIATLAALLHDLGKSTLGFQDKLINGSKQADPYRHEWLSLKLFLWLVQGCDTDKQWLERFNNINEYLSQEIFNNQVLQGKNKDISDLDKLPPLAQWMAWLIVSHHRLPPLGSVFFSRSEKENLRHDINKLNRNQENFYKRLKAADYWVKNPIAVEECQKSNSNKFWQMEMPVINSKAWQKHLKRWTRKALEDTTLTELSLAKHSITDPLLMHLSRLCLMLGDHNYSSLDSDDKRRVSGSDNFKNLAANTERKDGKVKQSLDEHLIGVAKFSAAFAKKLPAITSSLPALQQHTALERHTNIERFSWQNKAYDLAKKSQEQSDEHGFFGVNMASTGCGKTIANARIMYGLANPEKGARFTIALGLRVLTLQTGQSFRNDLQLGDDQLAVLVGGSAHKELFEYNQKTLEITAEKDQETYGSESAEELVSENIDGDFEDSCLDEFGLGTVIESSKAKALLAAPIITCTVDHIIQASECKRGGKYIAPMLRLLSSDLVLDEPDDFDHEDLPALARLMHMAGMLGSKVLLSSATLPPDLIQGLFKAYQAGRNIFNNSQNSPKPNIICAWFDENRCFSESVNNVEIFTALHEGFTQKRAKFLDQQVTLRKAKILPLDIVYKSEEKESFYQEIAESLIKQAIELHDQYHITNEESKTVSVGLIRIANIEKIIALAKAMYSNNVIESDTQIHLCCYHAKQLLILRNSLENKLDRILKRDEENPNGLLRHPEISKAIKNSELKKQVFIVMATPVAEVGRDHDYDWAIIEPSSMRSIIQLAGRVWRHRPNKKIDQANIAIMQYNIKSFESNHKIGKPIFTRPGFENKNNLLITHNMQELITSSQLEKINANARVLKPNALNPEKYLADLEQQVMQTVMNASDTNYVNAYWHKLDTSHRSHTFLQTISEFRKGQAQEDWVVIPDRDDGVNFYSKEQIYKKGLRTSNLHNDDFKAGVVNTINSHIKPWLTSNLKHALEQLQNAKIDDSLESLAIKYSNVSLEDNQNGWCFNESFGFWRCK